MPFLERIARHYLALPERPLHDHIFVFPNHRACLHFTQYIKKNKPAGKTIWAPPVYSISDFIVGLSDCIVPDPLDLIFILFNLYQERIREYPRKFEDFYPWGKMILADFNEIDKYLVDTRTLFRSLKAFKEVEDINRDEVAEIYNRYTSFWESLGTLYERFNHLLQKDRKAYEGRIYRDIATHIQRHDAIPKLGQQRVVFCGLNALTRAEEVIIHFLLKQDRADIYWDMERYFVEDENQEAGHFFRQNKKSLDLSDPLWVDDCYCNERTISIIGVQSKISQAKVLGLKLKEQLATPCEPEQIAIVLPDETLLFPTLNSLPPNLTTVNITLGFPLAQTPVYYLFNSIIEMQLFAQDLAQSRVGAPEVFYYKDVQKLLAHPYIKPIAPKEINEVLAVIKRENVIYVTLTHLKDLPPPLLEFFCIQEDSRQLLHFFLNHILFIRRFYQENQPDLFPIDYEYLYRFYTLLTRLNESLETSALVFPVLTFRQLFIDIVQNSRIPFTGEPLEGVQIMGMLETQAIDFKHVYILSLNEDHLPPGKTQQSFIPHHVRHMVKLPTYQERDAIAAYHFYRLLKRAEHVTLLYTTAAKSIEKSEKSRFIDQLLIEFADKNPKTRVSHHIIDFQPTAQPVVAIQVAKSSTILEKLAARSYSASALSRYLACPLQFYFTYVLRIREEEEILESPDAILIGTIIHKTLQTLYSPYLDKGTPLSLHDITAIHTQSEQVLKKVYLEVLPNTDIDLGRNKIIFHVMQRYLNSFFEDEKKHCGFRILELEKKITRVPFAFSLAREESSQTVYLEGTIDRIDCTNEGTQRIIEYKTGTVKDLKLKITSEEPLKELFTGDKAVKHKIPFQLFFYYYLVNRSRQVARDVCLAVYPFKNTSQDFQYIMINGSEIITESVLKEFEEILKGIFQEIFDPVIPFSQTQQLDTCRICPYLNLCNRDPGESFY